MDSNISNNNNDNAMTILLTITPLTFYALNDVDTKQRQQQQQLNPVNSETLLLSQQSLFKLLQHSLGAKFEHSKEIQSFLTKLPLPTSQHIIRFLKFDHRITALSSVLIKYFYGLVLLLYNLAIIKMKKNKNSNNVNKDINTEEKSLSNLSDKVTIFDCISLGKNPSGKPIIDVQTSNLFPINAKTTIPNTHVDIRPTTTTTTTTTTHHGLSVQNNITNNIEYNSSVPIHITPSLFDVNITHDNGITFATSNNHGYIGIDCMYVNINDYSNPIENNSPISPPSSSTNNHNVNHTILNQYNLFFSDSQFKLDPLKTLLETCTLSFSSSEKKLFDYLYDSYLTNQPISTLHLDNQPQPLILQGTFSITPEIILILFYQLWTTKEALVKAFGTGFWLPASSLDLSKYLIKFILTWFQNSNDTDHDNNNSSSNNDWLTLTPSICDSVQNSDPHYYYRATKDDDLKLIIIEHQNIYQLKNMLLESLLSTTMSPSESNTNSDIVTSTLNLQNNPQTAKARNSIFEHLETLIKQQHETAFNTLNNDDNTSTTTSITLHELLSTHNSPFQSILINPQLEHHRQHYTTSSDSFLITTFFKLDITTQRSSLQPPKFPNITINNIILDLLQIIPSNTPPNTLTKFHELDLTTHNGTKIVTLSVLHLLTILSLPISTLFGKLGCSQ